MIFTPCAVLLVHLKQQTWERNHTQCDGNPLPFLTQFPEAFSCFAGLHFYHSQSLESSWLSSNLQDEQQRVTSMHLQNSDILEEPIHILGFINQQITFWPPPVVLVVRCCFPVLPCRATAERHCHPAIQSTWILPADAAWRHLGQHEGRKQLILWVCVSVYSKHVCLWSRCVILIKLFTV